MAPLSCLLGAFLVIAVAAAAPASVGVDLRTTARQEEPPYFDACANPEGGCGVDERVCMDRLALTYINKFRAENRVPALKQGTQNQFANALNFSYYLRATSKLAHQPGNAPLGCGTNVVGENAAYGPCQGNPVKMCFDSWVRSDGHRKNMLNPSFETVSVGVAVGRETTVWCTQTFARGTEFTETGNCAPAHTDITGLRERHPKANPNTGPIPPGATLDTQTPGPAAPAAPKPAPPAPPAPTPAAPTPAAPAAPAHAAMDSADFTAVQAADGADLCADFVKQKMKVKGVRLVAKAVDGECKYCVKDTDKCVTGADSAAANALFKKITTM